MKEFKYKLEPVTELPHLTCLRCGHTWNNRTAKPRQCPRCKSPKWNEPRKKEAEA